MQFQFAGKVILDEAGFVTGAVNALEGREDSLNAFRQGGFIRAQVTQPPAESIPPDIAFAGS